MSQGGVFGRSCVGYAPRSSASLDIDSDTRRDLFDEADDIPVSNAHATVAESPADCVGLVGPVNPDARLIQRAPDDAHRIVRT